VKGLFTTYGEVESSRIIVDQFTNRSRGFGFIEMTNREDGLKAIQALNNQELGGRSLKINEAKPKTDQRDRRRDSRW
jgi:RNA recognition motif-containing protein